MAEFQPSDANIQLAKAVVLEGWLERAKEKGESNVIDASGSCKFASLFFQKLFGGIIEGHLYHQYNVLDGKIYDLNADCQDVRAMASNANTYWHDAAFFGNPEHSESMMSCLPRVNCWVKRFKEYQQVF